MTRMRQFQRQAFSVALWEKRLVLSRAILILIGITVFGGILRFWGLNNSVNQPWLVDEGFNVHYALELGQWLIHRKDVDFYWVTPQAWSLLLLAAYGVYFLIQRATGAFTSVIDLLIMYLMNREMLYLIARHLSAAFSTLTIPIAYMLAARLFNRRVGLVTSFFIAILYPFIWHAHHSTPYSFAFFLVVLAGYLAVRIYQEDHPRVYALGGFLTGVLVSTYYYTGLVVLSQFFGHWFREGAAGTPPLRRLFDKRLVLLTIALVIGTLVAFPALTGAPDQVLTALGKRSGGFTGGNPLQNFALMVANMSDYYRQTSAEPHLFLENSMLVFGEAVLVFLAFGLVYGLFRFRKEWVLLAPPFLIWFGVLVLLGGWIQGVRHVFFGIPLIVPLAAACLVDLVGRLSIPTRWRGPVIGAVTLSIGLQALYWAILLAGLFGRPSTTDLARAWIRANVPAGATIATDRGYGPFAEWPLKGSQIERVLGSGSDAQRLRAAIERERPPFTVVFLIEAEQLPDYERLRALGVSYIAIADQQYRRYYHDEPRMQPVFEADPNLRAYAAQIWDFYSHLDEHAEFVTEFVPRDVWALGPLIKIYKLRAP